MSISVRVYTRTRPFNKRELGLGDCEVCFDITKTEIKLKDRKKNFTYDHNFGPKASQDEVFGVIGVNVTKDFMDGYNATQFVYGQTGAGKTWTMMGIEGQRGIIPRTSSFIFECIANKESGWEFEIHASYLEVYMENVNDLMDPDKTNLQVKEDPNKGVYVKDLTKEQITGLEDVYDVLKRGDKVRKVAATKMNPGSSRSHSVLTLLLKQTSPDGVTTVSSMNLVDLAGSERASKTGAKGDTLKQGALINQSLTTLSRVISDLAKMANSSGKKKVQIPYRQSKLTRLLQTSLGGNARTGLSIHMSPHIDNIEETISTLEFGTRAKAIKNKAVANVEKSVEQLEKELEMLKKKHARLEEAYKKDVGGKLPGGLGDADEDGEAGGGGGASFEELEEQKNRVEELEGELADKKTENENLLSDIQSLQEQVEQGTSKIESLEKDFEVKQLEVQTLETKLTASSAKAEASQSSAEQNSIQSQEIAELNKLVDKQREMLAQERKDNHELRDANEELSEELTEKTRRLALAELQVMRYENARARVKDNKIKVKITSKKARQGASVWSPLLDDPIPSTARDGKGGAVNYELLRKNTILEKFGTVSPIPETELKGGREGHLYERLYKKKDFVKRFFVATDAFLLCYEKETSSRAEPRYVIPLNESKIAACPKQDKFEYCFMVLCGQYFNVLATKTEAEKTIWLRDLNYCKFVTHENLLNLAYFNQRALETITDETKHEHVRARIEKQPFAKMGHSDYATSLPPTGGMEGVVFSSGVSTAVDENVSSKEWKPLYLVAKESFLLIYDWAGHSELQTEPRSVVHLGNDNGDVDIVTQHVEKEDDMKEDDEENTADDGAEEGADEILARKTLPPGAKLDKYFFSVLRGSDSITMYVTSEEERTKWIRALKNSSFVTIRNICLAAITKEIISVNAGINPTGRDLLGRLLDPGAVQPFDERAKPLFRHPDGRTLNSSKDMMPHPMKASRMSVDKTPLDYYNRTLPSGAVPMFAASPVEPVGVGVDGRHYAYPSGRVLKATDKHYDSEGRVLSPDVVKAADGILPVLKLATIVRSSILTRTPFPVYDAFGRLLTKKRDNSLVTLDGQQLPATAAVFDVVGNSSQVPDIATGLKRKLDVKTRVKDFNVVTLGQVVVEVGYTTVQDLHQAVKKNIDKCTSARITSITFLANGSPIPQRERANWICSDLMPEIFVVCREVSGQLMPFDGVPFEIEVDHEASDIETNKEKETDFVKMVGMLRRKRASMAMASSGGNPNITPRPGGPISVRMW